ncbi:MAG: mannan endo-1,4-beta-mannosidase A and B [Clostridia bacterium]|nr:mannan endo-1,4-beta-mannosidase A and B [Clostridia bacterium]
MKRKASVCIVLVLVLLMSSCSLSGKRAPTLSNPNADEKARAVYEYLCSVEGNGCLSAQQESTWMDSEDYETDYVFSASGKYPAMRGFDYMNDDFDGVNRRALQWWEKGGLVTVCWHTGADFSGAWDEAMNTEITDWKAALTEGTPENRKLLDGMDKAAKALSVLRDRGVPVLWRPFHEFDGAWFWWGKGGADNFVKLWRLMYERYTEHWKLDNLIWVLGFSHNGEQIKKWYPGDGYCDIVGADSYDGGAQPELYEAVKKLHTGKPMCFHECGANPTADELRQTPWLWFMTWHTEYLTDNNSRESLMALYESDFIITLDELPDLR